MSLEKQALTRSKSSPTHTHTHTPPPLHQDDRNLNGGKWIVRLRKGLASRYWEDLVLALIGDQFDVGDEICGAVISVRPTEDILSVWNKTATEQAVNLKIR